jgi:hypothetical protein
VVLQQKWKIEKGGEVMKNDQDKVVLELQRGK